MRVKHANPLLTDLFVLEILVSPPSEFEQHMYSSDPRPDTGSLNHCRSEFGITYISFIFLVFDSKPGSCQPICGIIILNKSFSSAKAAHVCSFRASGKNRRYLGCHKVMRSRGCAVQNKGITLKEKFFPVAKSCPRSLARVISSCFAKRCFAKYRFFSLKMSA